MAAKAPLESGMRLKEIKKPTGDRVFTKNSAKAQKLFIGVDKPLTLTSEKVTKHKKCHE